MGYFDGFEVEIGQTWFSLRISCLFGLKDYRGLGFKQALDGTLQILFGLAYLFDVPARILRTIAWLIQTPLHRVFCLPIKLQQPLSRLFQAALSFLRNGGFSEGDFDDLR